MNNAGPAHLKRCAALVVAVVLAGIAGLPAQTTGSPPAAVEETTAHEMLRAYLQVQEQLHATQRAIERNRQETEAAATRHADALTSRMQLLEQALAGERQRAFDALQRAHRLMLTLAGVFAGAGLLALLFMAWMQTRAVSRLPIAGSHWPALTALGTGATVSGLGSADGPLTPLGTTEITNLRLLGAIEQLEKRIQELEHLSHSNSALPAPGVPAVSAPHPRPDAAGAATQPSMAQRTAKIELLLGKGQALLDLDRADEALACFESALKLDPHHSEALVRKGLALEQARQPEAAIACYDRAIAADDGFTMAYLHKGGLCNRLARHQEALQCYEAALRTQGRETEPNKGGEPSGREDAGTEKH